MKGHCNLHGIYDMEKTNDGLTAADCPMCRQGRAQVALTPEQQRVFSTALRNSVEVKASPITQQEKAVIAAAKAWDADKSSAHMIHELSEAVCALSRPQPVSPDCLEIGQKFRFAQDVPEGEINVCVVAEKQGGPTGWRQGYMTPDGRVRFFEYPNDRCVYPIEQE